MVVKSRGFAPIRTLAFPLISDGITTTYHLAGTARMGTDPEHSVCDGEGRLHDCQNVIIADGSAFPTFPSQNPTLTIMAHALRVSRALASTRAVGTRIAAGHRRTGAPASRGRGNGDGRGSRPPVCSG